MARVTPQFPALPNVDAAGRVAMANSDGLLFPEMVRVRRGDCYAPDDPLVLAHRGGFDLFTPPALPAQPTEEEIPNVD